MFQGAVDPGDTAQGLENLGHRSSVADSTQSLRRGPAVLKRRTVEKLDEFRSGLWYPSQARAVDGGLADRLVGIGQRAGDHRERRQVPDPDGCPYGVPAHVGAAAWRVQSLVEKGHGGIAPFGKQLDGPVPHRGAGVAQKASELKRRHRLPG